MLFNVAETEKITANVYSIKSQSVNFYLFQEGNDIIAIDTGNNNEKTLQELKLINIDPKHIKAIFLTHCDYDHTGGINFFPTAKIYVGGAEEPILQGKKKRALWMRMKNLLREYTLVKDNEVITIGNTKIKAISTPGHTTGSTSYLINDRLLFTGDTLRLVKGKVKTFMWFVNMDSKTMKVSIRKLAQLKNIQLLATGHNGYTTDFNGAMSDWM
jgi:glyoxylase-like metal-dependent hydrolase (beta-lactamase superfamily II)